MAAPPHGHRGDACDQAVSAPLVLGDADRALCREDWVDVATTPEVPRHDGAIPFRTRIGVTGHVELECSEELARTLREQVREIQDRLLFTSEHDRYAEEDPLVRLAIVSQLAKGGDRLVMDAVFAVAAERKQEARLEAILPMERDVYATRQKFSEEDRRELDRLLQRASWAPDPPPGEPGDDAYRRAGKLLIDRCDVLIALWDGEPSGGPGGTADTLVQAARRARPCIWINPKDGNAVYDNFRPNSLGEAFLREVELAAGVRRRHIDPPALVRDDDALTQRAVAQDVREVLRESFRQLHRFNRDRLADGFERRATKELNVRADDDRWVAATFARAAEVADRTQRLFTLLGVLILAFGAAAAVLLGLNLSTIWEHRWLSAVEGGLLALAVGLFVVVRQTELHSRWLSARVLAERLRSAYYVALTDQSLRSAADLEKVFIDRAARDWVQRAVDEVSDRRPRPPAQDDARAEVARWIDVQIDYHRRAAQRHQRWDKWLTFVVLATATLTPVAALGHLVDGLEKPAVLGTIALPAISAAVGAWLTVAQHRGLHARYDRMQSDLAPVLHDVLDADGDLAAASLEAARIISYEGEDWFGTMWFLDVEHP